MMSRRNALLVTAVVLTALLAMAGDNSSQNPPKMTETTRMMLIRGLNAELVFIRRPFPMGQKGLIVKDGAVSPSEQQVEQMIAGYGPALKTGDRARITNIRFKGDKTIIFEINGGPKKKTKWYQHIQVSGMGGTVSPGADPNAAPNTNPRGSYVELAFDKYIPDLSVEQVKQMLRPVFDFSAISAAQAYVDTLPPKVKEAIKNHQVLVGMNREMVIYALGRPPKKYRDRDSVGADYEEWIYGEPPKDVQFVRFVGDEVVRLEIMKVDGEKIVRTEKEVDLKPTVAQAEPKPAEGQAQPGMTRPTLRRPGEEAPAGPDNNTPRTPLPGQPGPGQPPPMPAPSGQIPPQ